VSLTLHLFRDDLRLDDNPALAKAAESGMVIPLFVLDDEAPGRFAPGGASRWWLHHSLDALANALADRGSRLVVRRGGTVDVVLDILGKVGADAVTLTRGYAPWHVETERRLNDACAEAGIALRRFGGNLLFEPEAVTTKSGEPFKVFTPFWRACLERDVPGKPRPAPKSLAAPEIWPDGLAVGDLGLLPGKPDWSGGLADAWQPGEDGANAALDRFLDGIVSGYAEGRDVPGQRGTSRLSPHLRHGEIGPRRIWQAVRDAAGRATGAEAYLRELGWREFCHHLLFQHPDLTSRCLRPEFEQVPWRASGDGLGAWQRGMTGYPVVDAGMRELWHTGWMHNRIRMVTASFLVKHLLIDWRTGADWFWDTLVDADPANNAAGWQWVAGCGSDAAPYFRVFNPVLQGEKFDSGGDYVRRWIPEIANLPDKLIHKPWEADDATLGNAGIALDETYPRPIVDHKGARERALDAYKAVNSG